MPMKLAGRYSTNHGVKISQYQELNKMKHISYIIGAFLLYSCGDTETKLKISTEAPEINYFLPGTFSANQELDSALSKNFSKIFFKAGEEPVAVIDSIHPQIIRLTVKSNFFNDYCISLEKKDTVFKISLFI